MSVTLEQRNEYRQKIMAKWGMEGAIPEAVADEIRQRILPLWDIVGEEYSGPVLTFFVKPWVTVASRKRYDEETYLMKHYGSAPYRYATDFQTYRLTFSAT